LADGENSGGTNSPLKGGQVALHLLPPHMG